MLATSLDVQYFNYVDLCAAVNIFRSSRISSNLLNMERETNGHKFTDLKTVITVKKKVKKCQ